MKRDLMRSASYASRGRVFRVAAAALLLLSVGCSEGLDPASLLNKTRPLGVRVEAATDTTRSEVAPGETARFTLLMGHAAEEVPVSYTAILCRPAPTTIGITFCEMGNSGLPILVGNIQSGQDVVGDPTFDVAIPDAEELDASGIEDELLLLGAFCAGPLAEVSGLADPEDAETTSPCADPEDDGALFTAMVQLDRDDDAPNLHPVFSEASIAGSPWTQEPAPDAGLDGCQNESILQISLGEPVEIILRASGPSRESFLVEDPDNPGTFEEVREELQVTTLATGGEMERTFSFINEMRDAIFVEWLPGRGDRNVPTRVRFELVMRDGRGGIARWRRQVCVVD